MFTQARCCLQGAFPAGVPIMMICHVVLLKSHDDIASIDEEGEACWSSATQYPR